MTQLSSNTLMDILVIEDTKLHQDSAREQFLQKNIIDTLHQQGRSYVLDNADNYEQGKQKLLSMKNQENRYTVVLTDLMVPKGGRDTMSPKGMEYIFDLMPYGFTLALLAAKLHVPYIGIVTDINHHDHPMSACIDPISGAYWDNDSAHASLYNINNSVLGIFHTPFLENGAKDWMRVLEVLRGEIK